MAHAPPRRRGAPGDEAHHRLLAPALRFIGEELRAVFLGTLGSVIFLGLSAFGSYQAYEYTDSVQFCGQVCHKVMHPEYTAYQSSPHARVACVQCHIGPGTTWFVRSKISGSYQVYSVLFHKYSKPIPTPVKSLRPAKETCEQCHWPRQFYTAKLQAHTFRLSDTNNTPYRMNMLIKIGGGDPAHGAAEGIHAHMYVTNKISYITLDEKRENIPYVVSTGPDGKSTVYRSTETKVTNQQLRNGEHRTVDCIDCHNRPSHIYRNPSRSVNQAMEQGTISPTLPEMKRVAVESLEGEYKTQAQASDGIRKAISDFYTSTYPQVASARKADIEAAINQVQYIYSHNYFPEMNVSWKKFPDHIGHMYSDGCFRCHDGKHVSDTGKVITKDCNACHTLLSEQASNGAQQVSLKGLTFNHPGDVGDAWKDTKCSECHGPQT
jgi:hypothetical protein